MKSFFYCLAICLSVVNLSSVHIISLGQACNVAGALRDNNLRPFAYPFDWIVSPYDGLYQMFEKDFEDFLSEEFLQIRSSDRYGVIDKYGFHFVHDFPVDRPNDSFAQLIGEGHVTGGIICDNWKDFLPEVKAKYQRRIERLKKVLTGNEKVFFIRSGDMTRQQAKMFRNLLRKKYSKLDFELIVLSKEESMKVSWQLKGVKNRYFDETQSSQWKNLFDEFV